MRAPLLLASWLVWRMGWAEEGFVKNNKEL
jgi:hypothetical protein